VGRTCLWPGATAAEDASKPLCSRALLILLYNAFVTTSQIAAAVAAAAAAANDAVIYDVQSIDGADVDRDTST